MFENRRKKDKEKSVLYYNYFFTMNNIITSIECINHRRMEEDLGYLIKTTHDGYIRVLTDNNQRCCETFGVYVMKNQINVKKNLKSFVGKEIVRIVVSPLKKQEEDDEEEEEDDNEEEEDNDVYDEDDQTRWVEIYLKDDPDPLMLYLYNQHNGYYCHGCSIEWKGQVVPDENLLFRL